MYVLTRTGYVVMLLLLGLGIGSACHLRPPLSSAPRAINGSLNLTGWDFSRDGPVKLLGQWEFYWQQLIAPGEIAEGRSAPQPALITVPAKWQGYHLDGTPLSAIGYATYRLKITLKQAGIPLMLKIGNITSAHRLYVNGAMVSETGKVGRTADTTVSRISTYLLTVYPTTNELDLMFHVANFSSYRGGIVDVLAIGEASQMQIARERQIIMEAVVFGSIVIMGLYHFGLFLFRKTDRSPLYFALFCFLMALRILTTGEGLLIQAITSFPYELLLKIVFLSVYAGLPIFLLFTHALFPHDGIPWILSSFQWAGVGLSGLVLLTSSRIYARTLGVYELLLISGLGYVSYTIGRALHRRRQGAGIFSAGFAVLALTIVNDVLFNLELIYTGNLLSFGLLGFLLSQAIILSLRFSKAFTQVEQLSAELEEKNSELHEANQLKNQFLERLELVVTERTKELAIAKNQAEAANRTKSLFIANVSHELRTPLNIILGFTQILLRSQRPPEEQDALHSILQSGNHLLRLVNRLIAVAHLEKTPGADQFELSHLLAEITAHGEQRNGANDLSGNGGSHETISMEALLALPADLFTELTHAAETLNIEAVNTVITRISPENPALAEALARLLKTYRFDVLQGLLQPKNAEEIG